MKPTDKEILDFVKDSLIIGKGMAGNLEIKDVLCSIRGNVCGDVGGSVK